MLEHVRGAGDPAGAPGFAALVGLHAPGGACGQNLGMAGEIELELSGLLAAASAKYGGRTGGFSGDGFLLFFTGIESAILCLSGVIRDWETARDKYAKKYLAAGIAVSDERFLTLSTGISFGNIYPLTVKGAARYSGPGPLKSLRCYARATNFLGLKTPGELNAPYFIFMDGSAERLVRARGGFYILELLVSSTRSASEQEDTDVRYGPDYLEECIYAVWPKDEAAAAACNAADFGTLAPAQAKADIADRLLLAANSSGTGESLSAQAAAEADRAGVELLVGAVTAYKEALQGYASEASPRNFAHVQYGLAKALHRQACALAFGQKSEKARESAAALKEALRIFTIETDPRNYARAQNSLGNAMRVQASQLAGDEKREKNGEAMAAYREALKVFTPESDPEKYTLAQNGLGNAADSQSDYFSGREKIQRLDDAVRAYTEALRACDFESFPEGYSGTHFNLGSILAKQAQLFSGQARQDIFNDALRSCREALRGFPSGKFPRYHAAAHNKLASVLKDAAEGCPEEKRAAMLDEAIRSCEAALEIAKPGDWPDLCAATQLNLGDTLTAQAGLLAGVERAQKINNAAQAYNEALAICSGDRCPGRRELVARKRAELHSLTEQAEKEAAVGRITAQVAHDIRSPLVALDAALKYADSMPEEQRVMLRHAVNRIRDIASNLLGKNKGAPEERPAEPGQAARSPAVFLLSSLVEPVIAEKRLQHGLSGADLDFELPQSAYGVFAAVQPGEFGRLLSNLINNSVEALEKKGRVTVSLGLEGGYAVVKVSDNGKGISPETLGKLGRRGFTSGKAGGSGLGLYHARTAVESWGGKLDITSEPGKGTTVSVFLPAASPADWFVSELELKAGRCVVVLDDDETIHRVWRGRLQSSRATEKGVELCSFSSPEALRGWIKGNPVQAAGAVFLLDYELLGSAETGLDLARALGLENRSVLVTSRYEEKHLLEQCRRLKLRIIPKGLAGLVPIIVATAASAPPPGGLAVLIDDDDLVRLNWKAAARAKGVDLKVFSSPAEFYAAADISKDARLYVDSDLGAGIKGEDLARDLRDKGYLNICLETGHPAEKFSHLSWLKVAGKEPPW